MENDTLGYGEKVEEGEGISVEDSMKTTTVVASAVYETSGGGDLERQQHEEIIVTSEEEEEGDAIVDDEAWLEEQLTRSLQWGERKKIMSKNNGIQEDEDEDPSPSRSTGRDRKISRKRSWCKGPRRGTEIVSKYFEIREFKENNRGRGARCRARIPEGTCVHREYPLVACQSVHTRRVGYLSCKACMRFLLSPKEEAMRVMAQQVEGYGEVPLSFDASWDDPNLPLSRPPPIATNTKTSATTSGNPSPSSPSGRSATTIGTTTTTNNNNNNATTAAEIENDTDRERRNDATRSTSIVPCIRGCGESYCSEACRDDDARRHGHFLLCTGEVKAETNPFVSSSSMSCAMHQLQQRERVEKVVAFKIHAMQTNEIFLLAARSIAGVVETVLRALDKEERKRKTDSTEELETKRVTGLLRKEFLRRFGRFKRNLWWDVVVMTEEEENGGTDHKTDTNDDDGHETTTTATESLERDNDGTEAGADPEKKMGECDTDNFSLVLRELARDSLELLQCAILADSRCCGHAGLLRIFRAAFEAAFDLDTYGGLVGMFEQYQISIEVNSSLRDFAQRVDDALSPPRRGRRGRREKIGGGRLSRVSSSTRPSLATATDATPRTKETSTVSKDQKMALLHVARDLERIAASAFGDAKELQFAAEKSSACSSSCASTKKKRRGRSNRRELFPLCTGTAMFSIACMLNHSCAPNVSLRWRNDPCDRLCMELYAIRNVARDEELCYSYIDENLSYVDRQSALADYGFTCIRLSGIGEGGKPKVRVEEDEVKLFRRVYLKESATAATSPVTIPKVLDILNLAEKGHSRALKDLDLSRSNIDDIQAQTLFRTLRRVALFRRVDLSGNRLRRVETLKECRRTLRHQLLAARHAVDCPNCHAVVHLVDEKYRHLTKAFVHSSTNLFDRPGDDNSGRQRIHHSDNKDDDDNGVEDVPCPHCGYALPPKSTLTLVVHYLLDVDFANNPWHPPSENRMRANQIRRMSGLFAHLDFETTKLVAAHVFRVYRRNDGRMHSWKEVKAACNKLGVKPDRSAVERRLGTKRPIDVVFFTNLVRPLLCKSGDIDDREFRIPKRLSLRVEENERRKERRSAEGSRSATSP
eukprot:g3748.t1